MEVKILPKSVQESLKTGTTIKSVAHCITQLVFNSLDAKSTSVAIRVNLITHDIHVLDNGKGISKNNFQLVGQRYATSKYLSIKDLKLNAYLFGQRGTALASIIKLSKTVRITTKTNDTPETYVKTFENGKSLGFTLTSERASAGTTVLIEDFMYNLPVRQSHMKHNSYVEEIKNEIEIISLIHPSTSFSLRHDPSGEIIFQTYKSEFVHQITTHLYGKEFTKQLRKIQFSNDTVKITGVISVVAYTQNKTQHVYVNKRHLKKSKIHCLLNSLIGKSKILRDNSNPSSKQHYGVYIINLKCPRSEYDIVDFNNIVIEFRNWDEILDCVEQAVKQVLEKENLFAMPKERGCDYQVGSPLKEQPIQVRASQYDGVIRGVSVKRKQNKVEEVIVNSKLTEITTDSPDNSVVRRKSKDSGESDTDTKPHKKKQRKTIKSTEKKLLVTENSESNSIVDLVSRDEGTDKEDERPIGRNVTAKELVREIISKVQKPKKTKNYTALKIKSINNHKGKDNHNNIQILKSMGSARDIMLDMFLKSTVIFKTDDDLKREFASKTEETVIDKPIGIVSELDKPDYVRHDFNRDKSSNLVNGSFKNQTVNKNYEYNWQQQSRDTINKLYKQDSVNQLSKNQIFKLNHQDSSKLIVNNETSNQDNIEEILGNQMLERNNREIFKGSNKIQIPNKEDNYTQICKNEMCKIDSFKKPRQISRAIQVSGSQFSNLNWHPEVRRIDPFQLCNSSTPLNTKCHPNSNTLLNQNIPRHKRSREEYALAKNYPSSVKEELKKYCPDNHIFKKPLNTKGQINNFKFNFKVKKVLKCKDIFRKNIMSQQKQNLLRKQYQDITYNQMAYGRHGRNQYGHQGHKMAVNTRLNFRLLSSTGSTFAHRHLTSFRFDKNNYNYSVKKTLTKNYVHSSDFIKPAPYNKFKQERSSLNSRKVLHINSMIKTRFDKKKNITHNTDRFGQNVRDTRILFGNSDEVVRERHLPYAHLGYDNFHCMNQTSGDNNKTKLNLKPVTNPFQQFDENMRSPYFKVRKNCPVFETKYRPKEIITVSKPSHQVFDTQNYFKLPEIPRRNHTCAKNLFDPNISRNSPTISQSIDITFATVLPESEGPLSIYDNEEQLPNVKEVAASKHVVALKRNNSENSNMNYDYNYYSPYTEYSDYSSYKSVMNSPVSVNDKREQLMYRNYQNNSPDNSENVNNFEVTEFANIPQTPEDTFIPFSTNPNLNKPSPEKTRQSSSNHQDIREPYHVLSGSFITETMRQSNPNIQLQRHSDSTGHCNLYQDIQGYEESVNIPSRQNIFTSQNKSLESNPNMQLQRHVDSTGQCNKYQDIQDYEESANIPSRKTIFTSQNERPVWPNIHLEDHEKLSNRPEEEIESINISFTPRIYELPNVQMDNPDSVISVSETSISEMGCTITSSSIHTSNNVNGIVNKYSENCGTNNISQEVDNYVKPAMKADLSSSEFSNNDVSYLKETDKTFVSDVLDISSRKLCKYAQNHTNNNSRNVSSDPNSSKVRIDNSYVDLESETLDCLEEDQINLPNNNRNYELDFSVISVLPNRRKTDCHRKDLSQMDYFSNKRLSNHNGRDLSSAESSSIISCSPAQQQRDAIIISDTNDNDCVNTPISEHSTKSSFKIVEKLGEVSKNEENNSNENISVPKNVSVVDSIIADFNNECSSDCESNLADINPKSEKNIIEISNKNPIENSNKLSNNGNDVSFKNESVVENIIADFNSECSYHPENNLAGNNKKTDKSIIEISKNIIQNSYKPNNDDHDVSAVEDILMDLENIINSLVPEINLDGKPLMSGKDISQLSSNNIMASGEMVDIVKNTSDVENNPNDFEITFDFDPKLNLENPNAASFQRNNVEISQWNIESNSNIVNNNRDNNANTCDQQHIIPKNATTNHLNQVTDGAASKINFMSAENEQSARNTNAEIVNRKENSRQEYSKPLSLALTTFCNLNGEKEISNEPTELLNSKERLQNDSLSSSYFTNEVRDSNKSDETEIILNADKLTNINNVTNDDNNNLKLETANGSIVHSRSSCNSNVELPNSTGKYSSAKRPSFLPKGMSPILHSVSNAPIKELSQNSKKRLHEIMAKIEHDDLQTVKWMKYFETKDAKSFFADLYTNKRNYEKTVPNIDAKMVSKKVIAGFANFTFSKESFDSLKVISQWDNKFIVTNVMIGANRNKLVLFDQHAVHERIRLENLLKEYAVNENQNLKSIKCSSKINLKLEQVDIRILKNYKENLYSWGFVYYIKDKRTAIFTEIPACWEPKDEFANGETATIQSLIKKLIDEMSNWLRNSSKINISIPHVILDSIKLKACRGAVKFGDALTKEQCEEFMKQLSFCDLPFQCAHGRPTLVPIFNLNELNTPIKTRKINWNTLKVTN